MPQKTLVDSVNGILHHTRTVYLTQDECGLLEELLVKERDTDKFRGPSRIADLENTLHHVRHPDIWKGLPIEHARQVKRGPAHKGPNGRQA